MGGWGKCRRSLGEAGVTPYGGPISLWCVVPPACNTGKEGGGGRVASGLPPLPRLVALRQRPRPLAPMVKGSPQSPGKTAVGVGVHNAQHHPPFQECRPLRRAPGQPLADGRLEEPLMLLLEHPSPRGPQPTTRSGRKRWSSKVRFGPPLALAHLSQSRSSKTAGRGSRGCGRLPHLAPSRQCPRLPPPPPRFARGSGSHWEAAGGGLGAAAGGALPLIGSYRGAVEGWHRHLVGSMCYKVWAYCCAW